MRNKVIKKIRGINSNTFLLHTFYIFKYHVICRYLYNIGFIKVRANKSNNASMGTEKKNMCYCFYFYKVNIRDKF